MALDEDLVDEDALEGGRDQVGDHQGQPGQDHERQRRPGRRQPPDQPRTVRWAGRPCFTNSGPGSNVNAIPL